jgi:hypothetical protein
MNGLEGSFALSINVRCGRKRTVALLERELTAQANRDRAYISYLYRQRWANFDVVARQLPAAPFSANGLANAVLGFIGVPVGQVGRTRC